MKDKPDYFIFLDNDQYVLPGWLKGDIKPQPQDEFAVTYSGTISKEDGEILGGGEEAKRQPLIL
jgi:GT2 family glycosyltransferase